MGSGMKALDTKAFIPLPISLITCVMRGPMKEMKCGMEMSPADLDIVKKRHFKANALFSPFPPESQRGPFPTFPSHTLFLSSDLS